MRKIIKRMEEELELELTEKNIDAEEEDMVNEADFMNMIMEEINSKTLNIVGNFDENMVKYVRAFTNSLWYYDADEKRPLYVNITSRGGEADALFAILDMLDYCKEEWGCKIITNCDGYAQSCGFILWCYGDERYMGRHGEVMCHPISYGMNGFVFDHDCELRRSKKIQAKIDNIITSHTPLTQKQLNKWYRTGYDKFIDYEEANKLGLITVKNNEDNGQ